MGCIKRIWYLSPMRAAKVQASLCIRAVLPEPPLLAHTISESRGTFRQKTRSLAPLNGWTCAVEICHDGMLEDTNSPDGAQMIEQFWLFSRVLLCTGDKGPVKRICVFKQSVMTNFNCVCPAIQRGKGSGFLSEVSLDSLLVWASSGGSGETARMRRLAWTFAARICDKYQRTFMLMAGRLPKGEI